MRFFIAALATAACLICSGCSQKPHDGTQASGAPAEKLGVPVSAHIAQSHAEPLPGADYVPPTAEEQRAYNAAAAAAGAEETRDKNVEAGSDLLDQITAADRQRFNVTYDASLNADENVALGKFKAECQDLNWLSTAKGPSGAPTEARSPAYMRGENLYIHYLWMQKNHPTSLGPEDNQCGAALNKWWYDNLPTE